jgi:four helix bundle protein
MIQIWALRYRQSGSDRLEKQQTDLRRRHHYMRDGALEVYQGAMSLVMRIFELAKNFPIEERYALTDQVRGSSRSVCANLAEAWRRRRYEAAFVSKLNDSETEAAETQVHIEIAFRPRHGAPPLEHADSPIRSAYAYALRTA